MDLRIHYHVMIGNGSHPWVSLAARGRFEESRDAIEAAVTRQAARAAHDEDDIGHAMLVSFTRGLETST